MKKFFKKVPFVYKFVIKMRVILASIFFRESVIKKITVCILSFIGKMTSESTIVNIYTKYNHGEGGVFRQYLGWCAFYAVIDPEIRKNPQSIKKYQNLLFKDEAALAWSIGTEKAVDYYLKGENHSILSSIIELVNNSKKKDWKFFELGCGGGNCIKILSDSISSKFEKIDGVDFSKPAIEYAKCRFDSDNNIKHNFFVSDIKDYIESCEYSQQYQYDIIFSHLVLQYFDEDYLLNVFRLVKEKNISKAIYISDSYLDDSVNLMEVNNSIYNPGRHGYLRFDHNHYKLLEKVGFPLVQIIGDYRNQTDFLFVKAEKE